MSKLLFLTLLLMGCFSQHTVNKVNDFDLQAFARQNSLTYVETIATASDKKVLPENEQGIVLILSNPSDGNRVDKALLLQGVSGLAFSSKTIALAYNESGMLLKMDGNLYGLRLSGYKGFFDKVKVAATMLEGYGLAKYQLDADRTTFIDKANSDGFLTAYASSGGNPPVLYFDCIACGSGGDGASHCQIMGVTFGCEVTCNTGYYACCNMLTGCKCCRE